MRFIILVHLKIIRKKKTGSVLENYVRIDK